MTNRRSFITGVAGLAAATAIPNVFAQAAAATGSTEPTLARVQRTKTLRIGAVRGAAPYYNKDLASGEWGGFMIDFAKSLAASLNVKLDITETTWGNSVDEFPWLSVGVTYLPIPVSGAMMLLYVIERLTIGPPPQDGSDAHVPLE